jgi:hypothetical protein
LGVGILVRQEKHTEGKSTVDLGQIEKKLNEQMANESFRKEFFGDPVATLRREGLVIPHEKEVVLKELVSGIKSPETALANGGIGISITIRF